MLKSVIVLKLLLLINMRIFLIVLTLRNGKLKITKFRALERETIIKLPQELLEYQHFEYSAEIFSN